MDISLRRFMPEGLYWRSLLIVVVPMVLLQAIVALIFLERHWNTVTRRLSHSAAGEIALVSRLYLEARARPDEIKRFAEESLDMKIDFLPLSALPPEASDPFPSLLRYRMERAMGRRTSAPFWIDTDSGAKEVEIRLALPDAVLRILIPHSRVYATQSYIFIVWMVGASGALLLLAILLLRNQILPIQRLSVAARRFGRGLDAPEFKPSGAREVREAAAAFMDMRRRLNRHVAQRTEMLAGVSHDLRTALTRFKLELALLPESETRAALAADADEMGRMLEAYLAFAKGSQGERPSRVSLRGMIEDIARRARPLPELRMDDPLTARVRPVAMRRCIENLVSNACAHGKRVLVSGRRGESAIEIWIEDDGPGLPAEQHEEVFRPFYRLDAARNQDRGGSGLGLAIARDAARAAGGDITLDRSPHLGGLRACLRLPR